MCSPPTIKVHGPFVWVVETLQQGQHRGLAPARWPDERDGRASCDRQAEPGKHGSVRAGGIGKVDILQLDGAVHGVGRRAWGVVYGVMEGVGWGAVVGAVDH